MVRWNRSPEMESFFFKVWDSFSASLKVQQPYTFIAVHCILGMGSCSVRLRYTQVRLKSGLKYTNQCLSFSLMKTRNRAKRFFKTINKKGYFSSLLPGKTLKSLYIFLTAGVLPFSVPHRVPQAWASFEPFPTQSFQQISFIALF